jgi:pimeloyl-ACP methyl ester carboxylesterase
MASPEHRGKPSYRALPGENPATILRRMTPDISDGPDLSGHWHGMIDTGTVKAKLGFRIDGDTAWLIIPARGEVALALWRRDGEVGFEAAAFDVALALKPAGGGLAGTCRHGGVIHPVSLAPGLAPKTPRGPRPQTPAGPFPYEVEEVSFRARDGVRLAGTLTRPPGPGPHPAVALSTWYGPTDRDQTLAGHKPFAIWADELTRRGFATLRFDKRGMGASGGDFDATTTRDSVDDLGQAMAFLRGRPEIDPDRIGLMGHSEGSHISADAAAADPRVAFCVMMTPGGVAEEATLETELFRAARAVGAEPVDPDLTLRRVLDLARIEREAGSAAEAVAGVRAYMTPGLEAGRIPADRFEWRAALAASPWRRNWIAYDHIAGLRALTCPVLVVFAGQDLQTAPRWHAPGIEAALAGRPGARTVTLPGLNHMLQRAVTGAPSEYGDLEESLAPEAIATVCDWVAETVEP